MKRLSRTLLVFGLLAAPSLGAARTHGLVIGIDDYAFVTKLDGARADALDIASALRKSGISSLTLLLDKEANRQSIERAWKDTLDKAVKGDVIILSYAGHGAQIPERIAGDEKDALDEFWVLPGFDPKRIRETSQETLFDNELHDWFETAADKGVRVIFVSDSCHAGGMDRAIGRKLRYVEIGKSRLLGGLFSFGAEPEEPAPKRAERLPDNVTMLAATSEALPVPEVVINGKARGALSFSVARALEGHADRDGDGAITRIELEDYVLATVRARSESLQTPVFAPVLGVGDELALIALGDAEPVLTADTPEHDQPSTEEESTQVEIAASATGGGQAPDDMAQEVAALETSGGDTYQRNMKMARAFGFKPALALTVKGQQAKPRGTGSGENPFVWDASTGKFQSPNGDLAAEDVTPERVENVVSKYVLLDFLKAVATRQPGAMRVSPVRTVYHRGDRLSFEPVLGKSRNMLVFNLANNGEVQYVDRVADSKPVESTPLREVQVVAPFGADHLVAIYSDEPLDAVGNRLKSGISTEDAFALLSKRVDFTRASVAILPIYTKQ